MFLFCGVEHAHPGMVSLDDLVFELLGAPRLIGEPFHPSIDTTRCPPEKLPRAGGDRGAEKPTTP